MKIRVCNGRSCSCFGSESAMRAVNDFTGLRPGESNKEYDVDYTECLGWCSNAPNVEVDDSRVLFDVDPGTIMERIQKGEGTNSAGQDFDLDKLLEDDIVYGR